MSSELQHKLNRFQPTPPPRAWERIAAALDEAPEETVAERLFQFEASPPPSAWNRVAAALDQPEPVPAPVVPLHKRPIVRWMSAAAAVVVIALSATWIMQTGPVSTPTVADAPAGSPPSSTPGGEVQDSEIINEGPAPVVNTPIQAGLTGATGTRTPAPKGSSRPRPSRLPMMISSALIPAVAAWEAASRSEERYMIYSDGNGSPVKMSKKMFGIFSCAQEDLACRERIRAAQQRISNAALNSDFMGMLDLLSELKENQ